MTLPIRRAAAILGWVSILAACSGTIAPGVDAGSDASTAKDGAGGASDTGLTDSAAVDATALLDGAAADAALPDGAASACTLPVDVGPCDAAIPRWYFDPKAGRCRTFSYGGCGGNANNFKSAADCAATCAPGEPAPCTRIDCFPGQICVYTAATPVCAAPCNDAGGCAIITQKCTCGASCPFCKDCVRVCM